MATRVGLIGTRRRKLNERTTAIGHLHQQLDVTQRTSHRPRANGSTGLTKTPSGVRFARRQGPDRPHQPQTATPVWIDPLQKQGLFVRLGHDGHPQHGQVNTKRRIIIGSGLEDLIDVRVNHLNRYSSLSLYRLMNALIFAAGPLPAGY